jgi:hypothetical protein
MRNRIEVFVEWYNQHRPHTALNGQTPEEVHFKKFPACRCPRIEPRATWPRASPCASPHALLAGKPGARFELEVEHFRGHSHLPIVRLRRAACCWDARIGLIREKNVMEGLLDHNTGMRPDCFLRNTERVAFHFSVMR